MACVYLPVCHNITSTQISSAENATCRVHIAQQEMPIAVLLAFSTVSSTMDNASIDVLMASMSRTEPAMLATQHVRSVLVPLKLTAQSAHLTPAYTTATAAPAALKDSTLMLWATVVSVRTAVSGVQRIYSSALGLCVCGVKAPGCCCWEITVCNTVHRDTSSTTEPARNAMRPVRTVLEKDLCLVALVWPLTFLPHLVCAPLNAPLGTMLMRAKCVKSVTVSVGAVRWQECVCPAETRRKFCCSASVSMRAVPSSTTSTPPHTPAGSVTGAVTHVGVLSALIVCSVWKVTSCRMESAFHHALQGPTRTG